MPDNTTDELKAMQDDIVQKMEQFSAENPTIIEALNVLNITIPDYMVAVDALRGSQTASVSAYSRLPITVNA